jgi:hypothetical protein
MRSFKLRGLFGGLCALAALGVAPSAEAVQYFEEAPNALGMQPCNGSGCWTNYLRVTDIDGDKDLDIVVPNARGFFSKGMGAQPLVIYQNDGTGTFTNISATSVGGYSNWIRQVAMGDVDKDGDPDMYVPTAFADPDKFFINDGKGVFTDESATRLPNVASSAGAVRFGDVDNDGDLDLLVGAQWTSTSANATIAKLYLNDGKGVFSEAAAPLPTMKKGAQPDDFDLIDADGDFDLDLFITMHTGSSSLWLNDGTGTFTDAPFPAQAGQVPGSPYKYGSAVCDVDNDGDLDVFIDNAGPSYTEQLLINNGMGTFTDETVARITGNVNQADDNGLACIDVDGDGDLDAAIMSLSNEERVLMNDGTGKFTLIPDAFPAVGDPTLWFDFGDLNGDGRLDVVTGQGEGQPELERVYFGTMNAPVDATKPKLRAVEDVTMVKVGEEAVVRFGVSDNATTDEGPRLQKAYVMVTTMDSMTEVPAEFMGGDMFRAVLPAQAKGGDVTYAACATDMQGNSGCADAKVYTVAGDASSSSTGGVGGAGGAGGGTGAGGSPGPGVGGGGATTSASTGQGGGGGFRLDDTEGGCGCTLPGEDGGAAQAAGGGALLSALALYVSRLSRRRRSGSPRSKQ